MKNFIAALIILIFLHNCKKTTKDYSFFVAGHTYGKPLVDNVGFHPPFKKSFNFIKNYPKMSFGIFTGDIIIGYHDKDWDEVDRDLEKLGVKTYFAVGNHEVNRKDKRKNFEKRYGQTYFSFSKNKDLFIVLDPNLDHWNISGTQLDFLKKTLKKTKMFNNIFIFCHQVLWWQPTNIFKKIKLNSIVGRASRINFWSDIAPLLFSLQNNVYIFAGDVGARNNGHEYHYHKIKNISFIASGMGGGKRDNFIIVKVIKNKVYFDLISLNTKNKNALGKLKNYKLPR